MKGARWAGPVMLPWAPGHPCGRGRPLYTSLEQANPPETPEALGKRLEVAMTRKPDLLPDQTQTPNRNAERQVTPWGEISSRM